MEWRKNTTLMKHSHDKKIASPSKWSTKKKLPIENKEVVVIVKSLSYALTFEQEI